MATRVSAKGQVTIPKKIREALRLVAGDRVAFELNATGEVRVRKAAGEAFAASVHSRVGTQVRRRAAELFQLLRGLD